MTRILFIAAASALVGSLALTAVFAHPGGHGQRAERLFERMDIDRDGIATEAEARALAASRFAAMDRDGDGTVTRDERRAQRGERMDRRFTGLDADGDGSITLEDMQEAAARRTAQRFARLDVNKDAVVTLEEARELRHMRGGHRGRQHGPRGKRGPVTADKIEARILKKFARMDADGDGTVSREEVK